MQCGAPSIRRGTRPPNLTFSGFLVIPRSLRAAVKRAYARVLRRSVATSQSTGPDLNDTTTAPAEQSNPAPIEAVPVGQPTSLEPPRVTFAELGLSDSVLRAIAEMGYRHPTPIQEQAIPTVLMGRDVLGTAQTGTGKTAGFTLPMLDILTGSRARARLPRSQIHEPTPELARPGAEN